jgi:hypothetical protein
LESANVVGFNGTTLAAETYYMVAAQFDAVAGDGAGIAIKDLVKGNLPYGTEMQILRAGGGYDIYKYIEEAYDEMTDDFIPGWGDGGDNFVTTGVIPAGQGAWIKPTAAITATFASPL